jgi:hypothetical protein
VRVNYGDQFFIGTRDGFLQSNGITERIRVPSEVLVTVGVVNIEPDRVQLEVVGVKTGYYVLHIFLGVITVA